ncbi:MAG: large subunit ribosomal protein [Candidatus Atribacteria bacterium]|nr:large subunit ribosomal protein [Candidatus Atribacteria bacterium]
MVEREMVRVSLKERIGTGKEKATKLRREGWVPAVVYSRKTKDQPALAVQIKESDLKRILQIPGITHHIIELAIDGEVKKAIIKDIQWNPIKKVVWHVDFYQIQSDQKLTLTVPILVKGEAPGVKEGGVLEVIVGELRIECLPDVIPEAIEVDVSSLNIGDVVHVRDLNTLPGVTITNHPDEAVLLVSAVRAVEEEEEEEAEEIEEAAEEPEVVSRGGAQEE